MKRRTDCAQICEGASKQKYDHARKAYMGREVELHALLTFTADGVEWYLDASVSLDAY
jgi:uroporphyrinogen-III decarboxylase